MMSEDLPTAKHNRAYCAFCSIQWEGPDAHIQGSFHALTSPHPYAVDYAVLVKCHDGCCDEEQRR